MSEHITVCTISNGRARNSNGEWFEKGDFVIREGNRTTAWTEEVGHYREDGHPKTTRNLRLHPLGVVDTSSLEKEEVEDEIEAVIEDHKEESVVAQGGDV